MHTRRQLLRLGSSSLLLATSALGTGAAVYDADMLLNKLDPVTVVPKFGLNRSDRSFTISGIIFDFGVKFGGRDSGYVVYDLNSQYRSMECKIGVHDEITNLGVETAKYKFILDGTELASGAVRKDEPPKPLALDVTGGRSLRIELGNGATLGNPVLSSRPAQAGAGVVKVLSPQLLKPANKAEVMAENVEFQWGEVPEANTYTVQVILKKRQGRRRQPDVRMWAFTIDEGKTSFSLNLKDMPSGQYLWSVLAYDDSKIVGVFSEDRTFTVAR